jgi:hypothetical protein
MAPRNAAQRRDVEIEEDRDDEGFIEDKSNKTEKPDSDDVVESEDLDDEAGKDTKVRDQDDSKDLQDDEEDTRLAYDLEEQDDPQRGASRRQRRNRSRRQQIEQRDRVIAELAGQVASLKGVVDQMGASQLHLAASDVEARISQEQQRLITIDNAIEQAATENDGKTLAKAIRLRDEARDRLMQLGAARQRLVERGDAVADQPQNNGMQGQTPRQGAAGPDPAAVRYSETFMERHPWFDINGRDEDSLMVRAIDDALASEGYRPNTAMYWRELERRVKARGLGGDAGEYGEGDDMDDSDTQERRPPPRRNTGGMPPRAGRTGSRPAGANNFKLTAEMTEALDAEGLLDEKNLNDDQKKLRRKYVTTWRDRWAKEVTAKR